LRGRQEATDEKTSGIDVCIQKHVSLILMILEGTVKGIRSD